MPFGTTVTTYQQKPNKLLERYKANTVASPVNGPGKVSMGQLGGPRMSSNTLNRPTAGGANMTAASGRGSNVPTSPILQNLVSTPTFNPVSSGAAREDNQDDDAYGRLKTISDLDEILGQGSQTQIAIANSIIKRKNAQRQQQALYDQAYQAGGGGQSFSPDMNFEGGGGQYSIGGIPSGLSAEQMNNAKLMADIAKQRGLGDDATRIAIMTSLAESEMKNINFGDRDSLGLFQQRPSQGWGSPQQVTNPTYSINKFYSALQQTPNWQRMAPWQAAQAVQRSFDPYGNNYKARWGVAQAAFNALRSTPNAMRIISQANPQAASFIRSFNNRYIDYDGAFGNQCVDLYNYFTKFLGGHNIMVGWAPEIYNKYDPRTYARTGANVRANQGYVALFRPGGSTPSGHVAIVVGDNGNGTLRVLHSNATPAGSRGNTVISNISKSTLMGYLVPRKLYGG
jgi:hypothetical protein